MEYKLHHGLIYICTRGLDDFVTPLVKFLSTILVLNSMKNRTEEEENERQ